jgi:hypothetical protein
MAPTPEQKKTARKLPMIRATSPTVSEASDIYNRLSGKMKYPIIHPMTKPIKILIQSPPGHPRSVCCVLSFDY